MRLSFHAMLLVPGRLSGILLAAILLAAHPVLAAAPPPVTTADPAAADLPLPLGNTKVPGALGTTPGTPPKAPAARGPAAIGSTKKPVQVGDPKTPGAAGADKTPIIIGTGNILGVYFPTAGAICRRIRETQGAEAPTCREIATAGSLYNLSVLRRGFPSMNMAVVQGDTLYQAIRGEGPFTREGPDRNTRSILALAPEAFIIVTRAVGPGEGLASLRGLRVAMGAFGSGIQPTVDAALQAAELTRRDFRATPALGTNDQAFELCRNSIDAFLFVAATPSASVQEATAGCNATLVPPASETVQRLVGSFPYFSTVVIPGGAYQGNPEPVTTFGVPAILATRASTTDALVYDVVKAVMDNLPAIRRLHPALVNLQAEQMVPKATLAPLHPGALRYFREKHLL